jgi:hypothetical protein
LVIAVAVYGPGLYGDYSNQSGLQPAPQVEKPAPQQQKGEGNVFENGTTTPMSTDELIKKGFFLDAETQKWSKPPAEKPAENKSVVNPAKNTTATKNTSEKKEVSKEAGTETTKTKNESEDSIFKAKGLPATAFSWQGYLGTLKSWQDGHPTQFDYAGDTYIPWVPKGQSLRQALEIELDQSWGSVYGTPDAGFFSYSDSSSGAIGQYVDLLEKGIVGYYYAPKTLKHGRMDIIVPNTADNEEAETQYAFIGKNQDNQISQKDLTPDDDFKNVHWADGSITNPSEEVVTDVAAEKKRFSTGSGEKKTRF